jgi:hypothetical protein
MTVMLVVPVFPVASRTVPAKVCVPFVSPCVTHGIDTGPRAVVVLVVIGLPSALRVKVFDAPLVPSTQSTTQAVPLTVADAFGCVMKTLRVVGGGGGGGTSRAIPWMPSVALLP